MHRHKIESGFTLIELSIVLVIIGLIVGGILAGKDMIRASEMRAEITKLTAFEAAFNTFKIKYQVPPGDLYNTSLVPGVTAGVAHAGNGNGYIDAMKEYTLVWEHLSSAGLIEGRYNGTLITLGNLGCAATACPTTSFNTRTVHIMGGVASWWGAPPLYSSTYINSNEYNGVFIVDTKDATNVLGGASMLTVDQAYGLDAKLDDGKADTGRVLTANVDWVTTGCVSGDYTVTDGSANYIMSNTATNCSLVYVFR